MDLLHPACDLCGLPVADGQQPCDRDTTRRHWQSGIEGPCAPTVEHVRPASFGTRADPPPLHESLFTNCGLCLLGMAPGENGIERCDTCGWYADDDEARAALACILDRLVSRSYGGDLRGSALRDSGLRDSAGSFGAWAFYSPRCGHSACRQNFIDEGEPWCVQPAPEPSALDSCRQAEAEAGPCPECGGPGEESPGCASCGAVRGR